MGLPDWGDAKITETDAGHLVSVKGRSDLAVYQTTLKLTSLGRHKVLIEVRIVVRPNP
jgi:hypothetical protein